MQAWQGRVLKKFQSFNKSCSIFEIQMQEEKMQNLVSRILQKSKKNCKGKETTIHLNPSPRSAKLQYWCASHSKLASLATSLMGSRSRRWLIKLYTCKWMIGSVFKRVERMNMSHIWRSFFKLSYTLAGCKFQGKHLIQICAFKGRLAKREQEQGRGSTERLLDLFQRTPEFWMANQREPFVCLVCT